MEATTQSDRERRLQLARKVFKDFFAQCFWFVDPALKVEEKHIPMIVRELRLNGGHKGFRIAAELCRSETSNAK
jgi:hypothetical protein